MDEKLINKLKKREEEGTIRSLSHIYSKIDFYSNDYLGFSKIETISPKSIPSNYSSTGSRLLSGNSLEADQCEVSLADFFKVEKALVFNSGYDANVGFFSSVPQRGDTILYDEEIHASVRDGIRLSNARSFGFRHNDLIDLERVFKLSENTVYVAVESLYSMSGTIAPLAEIAEYCSSKSAFLIVDEAHSVGLFGENGRGLVDQLGIVNKVFARLVTFGKSYGAHGAAIVGSKQLIEYLINFSRPFIYTTALPPESYQRIENLVVLPFIKEYQEKLNANIKFFREVFMDYALCSDEKSPIQIIHPGSKKIVKELSLHLQNSGFAVKPIYAPTVPEGSECLRVCIHSFNSKEEIVKLNSKITTFRIEP